MKIYKYVPLHFVITSYYSRLSLAFNFSYWWLFVVSRVPVTVPVRPLRYLTWGNAFYHIWGGGTASPCVRRHFNHWHFLFGEKFNENSVAVWTRVSSRPADGVSESGGRGAGKRGTRCLRPAVRPTGQLCPAAVPRQYRTPLVCRPARPRDHRNEHSARKTSPRLLTV